ncbi:choice-of-anchor D domain-containing protein [Candidatus Bipolaricaulota bacterium]|nr:choice-of-anchor D domain-containing protein [Candidatus Bipolaricaulota bacterium]
MGFLVGPVGGKAQESLVVVINEFGQGKAGGNGEWVEFVVVGTGPCSSVDMRGWVFRDQQGDTGGGVYFVFQNQPVWAAVPAGTIIVVYNPGATSYLPDHFPASPDHDFDDFVVVLPANASGYFDFKRWDGLGNSGDSLVLLDDSGGTVDGISYQNGTGQNPVILNVGSTKAAWYAGDTQSGVNDSANWVVGGDGPGGSTPGAGNTRENTVWIQSLRPRPDIAATPPSHGFGSVYVGTESTPLLVTVTNAGCADLAVGTITIAGPADAEFPIQNDDCSGQTIPPGGSRTVEVVFRPTSPGAKSALLSIPTNDPDTPTVEVSLTGTGIVALGDVDGDGVITLVDVRLAQQAAYGLVELTPDQKARADMDGDGDVDLEDAEAIARRLIGLP